MPDTQAHPDHQRLKEPDRELLQMINRTCRVELQPAIPVRSPLSAEDLALIDRYWRAANYLSVGQIYLLDNPLLREPLLPGHVKPRLLGHWGTTPGLNFIYAHLNRIIRERDQDVLFICGPGHGGPAVVANSWLEGRYSELYPDVSSDENGMRRLFRQFSFPGGVPSHAAPQTPGSIHEGGELGYSLLHAYGAAFDNPDLTVACVVGDGEAETGPLAASWHSNKFVNPARDGVVLPILHLNGYKIAGPTIFGRMDQGALHSLLEGYGHDPIFVEGDEPATMHQEMACALDAAFDQIARIRKDARQRISAKAPAWPMIVLRSPKGWTGPNVVDGKKVEGFWRSHQVPIDNARQSDAHRDLLEAWLRSYRPEELFDRNGGLLAELRALAPQGDKRMSASPCANAGCEWKPLDRPDWCDYALDVSAPGVMMAESPRAFGEYLADVFRLNAKAFNFRIMSPDETTSNRLGAVFDATNRMWSESIEPFDEHLAPDGRVMEVLSEHLCQGWLEGYVLTGRHGLFNCYEAFIHIVDSMFNQHAKWLKVAREVDWRRPVPSLNYFLSSHVWRQDHNGFSHQDPGFIDHVANKKSDIVRIYFPPDANCLLWVGHHCFGTFDRINVIVCGKQPALQWLSRAEAERHCEAGIGKWEWAGTEVAGSVPDVIMACAGDIPTLETLAAADILRDAIPGLKIRLVNVVDLMKLQSDSLHPHGLPDERFDELFTRDRPVIFAFHSYPQLIHRLTYRRANHDNFHVHGFMEEGTTTTPFDMAVLNRLDRFHLALAVMDRVPALAVQHGPLRSHLLERLEEHRAYIVRHGEDMPGVYDWRWSEKSSEDDRRPG